MADAPPQRSTGENRYQIFAGPRDGGYSGERQHGQARIQKQKTNDSQKGAGKSDQNRTENRQNRRQDDCNDAAPLANRKSLGDDAVGNDARGAG